MNGHTTTTDNPSRPADWESRRPSGPIVALIPAYNEERFIGSLVLTVQPYVDRVVVVDDGSRDHTVEIAQRAGVTVVRHHVNQGKAAAVNTGFNYIRQLNPSAVVMLDGDGQHRVEDIPVVLEPIVKGQADLVIGSRFLEIKSDIPAYRQVGQHGLTMVTNLASGLSVGDSQSGFRAFSAEALKYISFSQGGFSIESEMQFLAREHKLRVVEVPIHVTYDEPAKRNPFGHGMQVINGIMQLVGQTRPLLFFSAAGLVLFVGGMGLGVYMIDIYRRSHDLAIGYGLMTVLLCVVGMLLFFAGVILHSTRGMLLELRRGVFERLAVHNLDQWHTEEAVSQEELAFELGK
jgi:glycosyltransferase involved in cell wall biosynthesis